MRLLLHNSGPVATLASGDLNSPLTGTDMSDTESMVMEGNNGILIDGDIISKISQSEELTHEFGTDDGSVNPPAAISSYIESSQMSIGAGDNFVFLSKLIPDVTFDGSTSPSPNVDFTLETRRFPGTDYSQTVQNNVIRSSTVPVEQFTDQVRLRMRGRSFALKIDSSASGVRWRLGTPRVDARVDGKR